MGTVCRKPHVIRYRDVLSVREDGKGLRTVSVAPTPAPVLFLLIPRPRLLHAHQMRHAPALFVVYLYRVSHRQTELNLFYPQYASAAVS
jgi:hypothetical protein